jgi:hypothetical protein
MVPATSLAAPAVRILPLAQKAAHGSCAVPFALTTADGEVVATKGGTTTICLSPDPAIYHRSEDLQKKLTNKIILHANVRAKVGNMFPSEGSSRAFAASPGGGLVPPATIVFTLSDALLDPDAVGFAAGASWLLPGAVAFALPRAFFASRLGSASLITARHFCAAS